MGGDEGATRQRLAAVPGAQPRRPRAPSHGHVALSRLRARDGVQRDAVEVRQERRNARQVHLCVHMQVQQEALRARLHVHEAVQPVVHRQGGHRAGEARGALRGLLREAARGVGRLHRHREAGGRRRAHPQGHSEQRGGAAHAVAQAGRAGCGRQELRAQVRGHAGATRQAVRRVRRDGRRAVQRRGNAGERAGEPIHDQDRVRDARRVPGELRRVRPAEAEGNPVQHHR